MDMKTVDTLACFSDSKMSNNFVNNKAIEKNLENVDVPIFANIC